jgi:hypothetical protein
MPANLHICTCWRCTHGCDCTGRKGALVVSAVQHVLAGLWQPCSTVLVVLHCEGLEGCLSHICPTKSTLPYVHDLSCRMKERPSFGKVFGPASSKVRQNANQHVHNIVWVGQQLARIQCVSVMQQYAKERHCLGLHAVTAAAPQATWRLVQTLRCLQSGSPTCCRFFACTR